MVRCLMTMSVPVKINKSLSLKTDRLRVDDNRFVAPNLLGEALAGRKKPLHGFCQNPAAGEC